jgi:hypothetical protein
VLVSERGIVATRGPSGALSRSVTDVAAVIFADASGVQRRIVTVGDAAAALAPRASPPARCSVDDDALGLKSTRLKIATFASFSGGRTPGVRGNEIPNAGSP